MRHRRLRARLPGSLRAAALLLAAAAPLFAQRAGEYEIKAAYLFNFGKFLRQPDIPEIARRRTFDICVLGRNDFGETLKRLTANEQSNGLPEVAVKVRSASEARNCAILFISSSEGDHIEEVLAALGPAPVLTVSDMPRFLQHGGMIALETQSNHVRFSVGLDAVGKPGLSLSSELLKVAWQVTGKPRREVP